MPLVRLVDHHWPCTTAQTPYAYQTRLHMQGQRLCQQQQQQLQDANTASHICSVHVTMMACEFDSCEEATRMAYLADTDANTCTPSILCPALLAVLK